MKKRSLTPDEKKKVIAFMDNVCKMPRRSKILPEYLKGILWNELMGLACDILKYGINIPSGYEIIKGGKNDKQ